MAFGDWDHFIELSNVNWSAALNITTPIIGSGSLSQGNLVVGGSSGQGNMTTHLNSGFTRGLTKGRLRSIVRWDWDVGSASLLDSNGFAFYYMASNLDITDGSHNFYLAGLCRERNVAGEVRPIISRGNGDDLNSIFWRPGGTDNIADSATNITGVVSGDTIAVQIEWNLDIAGLGGMRHTMSVGNIGDTDFNNLAVVYDFVEGSPLTTSVVEGLAMIHEDSDVDPGDATTWDNTGVFQLV